jgi:hypothetical protein
MNILPRDKQIEIISALCEGIGQRAIARLTGTNRKTVARLALRVGRGCAELHDRMMVGIRTDRVELDELWAFVGKKQARVHKNELAAAAVGDQYTFLALSASTRGDHFVFHRQAGQRQHSRLYCRLVRARDWAAGDFD